MTKYTRLKDMETKFLKSFKEANLLFEKMMKYDENVSMISQEWESLKRKLEDTDGKVQSLLSKK